MATPDASDHAMLYLELYPQALGLVKEGGHVTPVCTNIYRILVGSAETIRTEHGACPVTSEKAGH